MDSHSLGAHLQNPNDISVDDIYAKAKKVKTWAETMHILDHISCNSELWSTAKAPGFLFLFDLAGNGGECTHPFFILNATAPPHS